MKTAHRCYCRSCRPDKFKQLESANPNHYSVNFGDKCRIESVLFEGAEVINNTVACIAGRWGYIELIRTTDRQSHICAACGVSVCTRARRGEVVVRTLRMAKDERSELEPICKKCGADNHLGHTRADGGCESEGCLCVVPTVEWQGRWDVIPETLAKSGPK